MDKNPKFRVPFSLRLSILFVIFIVLVKPILSKQASPYEDTAKLLCGMDLSFLPLPYSNLPKMVCQPVWNSFLLRYSHSKDNTITIVLSTMYTTGWVGMGFSKDGMMLNASCMVGWISREGLARIKQYHVEGYTPSEVKPERGELPLTGVPPFVALHDASIYIAFQLKYATRLKTQPILLAFATKYPHHHHLSHHDDKTTIMFDFSSGEVDSSPSSPSSIFKTRKTHGVLGLLAWGLFLPVGAILARYLRHREPLWYYLHVAIQFTGFLLAIGTVVVGLSLNRRLDAAIAPHKGIGIFILTLSILQVLAFFGRPSKDSKYKRIWNWYHNWLGRLALFFGAVNIVLGIHIAGEAAPWRIGYGFLVGLVLTTCIVLEALLRLKRSNDTARTQAYQMDQFGKDMPQ